MVFSELRTARLRLPTGGRRRARYRGLRCRGVGAGVNIDIAAGTSIAFNNLTSPLTLQTGVGNSATFTATAGSITFASASSPLATSGGGLALIATTGIGTSAIPVETSVGNLEAQTGTGGIFIHNVGTLSIGGVLSPCTDWKCRLRATLSL